MKPSAYLLKIRLSAVTMGLLISASLSRAAFIDEEVFTTDTATGLDWLDVTETQGYSYNATLEAISAGGNLVGWRFATINEFHELIDSAVGEEGINDLTGYGSDVAIYDDMVSLVYLLGLTDDGIADGHTKGFIDSDSEEQAQWVAFGFDICWTKEPPDERGYDCVGASDAMMGYSFLPEHPISEHPNLATFGLSSLEDGFDVIGAFLVRATSVPDTGSSAVPDTGSTAALLGAGVAALAFARRRLG